jgi:energy-coupling factor transporter ATP-binding protein EcfA2
MTARIDRVALIGWRGCSYLELELDKGTFTGLVGGSGAGKSTIAMCLCFALLPDQRVLHIKPISEVNDSDQAGVDTLAARIDPLVGFGYVILDITTSSGKRVVAGIHVRSEDGGMHVTRFNVEEPPTDRRLQDFFRIVEGEEESYPDFGVLRASLASGGLTMRELRTVHEYGELLYEAGILPCNLKDSMDRQLYARLLESAFRGGISKEVSSQLKDYLLPPADRIPESVDRLQQCVQTVMRTQASLNESERQLRLLEATFGLGKAVVTRAIKDVLTRQHEAKMQCKALMAESETLRNTLESFKSSLPLAQAAIESTNSSRQLVIDEHDSAMVKIRQDQQHWSNLEITRSSASRDAIDSLNNYQKGKNKWKELAGDKWHLHDFQGFELQLEAASERHERNAQNLERDQELDLQRQSKLRAGVRLTNAASLSDALGGQTIAEALDQSSGEEALALEMALSGLVDGVVGVDLDALSALPDSDQYPDTFWLTKKLPEPSNVHKVGDWSALITASGYLVTSSRRKLTLGRQAREKEIQDIEGRLDGIRKRIADERKAGKTAKDQRDELLKSNDRITYYLANRANEVALADAVATAAAQVDEAQEKRNTAIEALSIASSKKDAKVLELDVQLARLQLSQQQAMDERTAVQTRLAEKARVYDINSKTIELTNEQLESIRTNLDDAFDWLVSDASEVPLLPHDLYISQQARDVASLGKELQGEPVGSLDWLTTIEGSDPVSCSTLWRPLCSIVSERISVDTLDQASGNLIASMASRRNDLINDLERDRAAMRAEAGTLYNVIAGEVRKQESRIKKLSSFGEDLRFGNVTGMRIRPSAREDLLQHLMNITKQIDLFAHKTDIPLQDQLSELFAKALQRKIDGAALLDYRTYMAVTIEARRQGKWEAASGLSGGESIGGGLAVALMLCRSLSQRSYEGRTRSYTPFFVVDEVQRLNSPGQAVIVEFGRRQGMQVLVTAISLEPTYDCTMYVLDRIHLPNEEIVIRRVTLDSKLMKAASANGMDPQRDAST